MFVAHSPKQVYKSTARPDVTIHNNRGYEYYNPSNVLQSWGAAEDVKTIFNGQSDIVYTRRPKGDTSIHSNFCIHNDKYYWCSGDVTQPQVISDLAHPGFYYKYWHGHSLARVGFLAGVAAGKAALGAILGSDYLFANAQGWINSAAIKTKPTLTKLDMFNLATQSATLLDENVMFIKKATDANIDVIESYKALYFEWKKNASLVHNVASQFLGLKFGLLPDVGDLNAASNGLLGFRKTLDKFRANVGRLMKTKVSIINSSLSKSGVAHTASQQNDYWSASLTQKVDAYIYYRIDRIDSFGKFDEDMRGLLATMGLELNPRVAWDAIPFSFVVDWFFNVGKVIERFKVPALELPITYVDSFVQYKQELQIESRTQIDVGSAISSSTTWPSWFAKENLFARYPIFPDYNQLTDLGFRLPTTNQATLLVALGAVLAL